MSRLVGAAPKARIGGVLSAVAGVVLALAVTIAGPASAARADEGLPRSQRVLILSVPSLTWADLDPEVTPNLARLVDGAAIANLTTRAVARNPEPGGAYLTVGAATRASGDASVDGEVLESTESVEGSTAAEVYQRRTGLPPGQGAVVVAINELLRANRAEPYDAQLGLLGDELERHDVERSVIANADGSETNPELQRQRQAALLLMDGHGRVPHADLSKVVIADPDAPFGLRLDPELVQRAFTRAWSRGGVVLVEGSDLARASRYRPFATPEQADAQWTDALRSTDQLLGELLDQVDPATDSVLLVAPYHEGARSTLTTLALRGPGVQPGLLRSATTRRAGYVTLVDVAPTVLSLLDLPVPDDVEGAQVDVVADGRSGPERISALAEQADRATFRDEISRPVASALAGYTLLLTLACVLLLPHRSRRAAAMALGLLALAGIGFLLSTHLAGLLPFDDWGTGAYGTFLVALSLALAAAARVAGIRRPLVSLGLLFGALYVLVTIDVVTGAHLQLNTALGYSATVAFRFSGLGNFAFAELVVSAVVLAGLAVHRIEGRRGLALAAAIFAVALLADAAPMWGADVGGVLAATPGFLITFALLAGWKIRWPRVVAIGGATMAVLALAGAVDLARPPEARTHLGHLLERVGNEGPGPFFAVVQRKLEGAFASLHTPWAGAVPGIVALVAYLAISRREEVRAVVARLPEARAVVLGGGLVGLLGGLLNDSGIAVPAIVWTGLASATVYVLSRSPESLGAAGPLARGDEVSGGQVTGDEPGGDGDPAGLDDVAAGGGSEDAPTDVSVQDDPQPGAPALTPAGSG